MAINPIDWIIQVAGTMVFPWLNYPFVLGADSAGEVVDVGSAVTRFKVGDRVLGHAVGSDRKRNSAAEGSFQAYTVLLENLAAPIPAALSYEAACVLPLALSTAACGLFERDALALAHPSRTAVPNGKTLVVWGGSTSVGSNAIQLAVAAGYDVMATASPRNFDYVKKLGAKDVFDYNAADVVPNMIRALRGKTIAGALAVGSTSALACVDIVAASHGNKFVSMATYPVSFAELSGPPGLAFRIATVRRFVWFNVQLLRRARLRGVSAKFIFGSSLAYNEVGAAIYADFLPAALAAGRYTAAPAPQVVGHGLETVQAALDVQKQGVSAAKIVVTLDS